jgi:two-component system, LytTR family, response regulator
MRLTCALVDDEPNAVDLLDMLIGRYTKWSVEGKFHAVQDAARFLRETSVDLVFLDINMPEVSGLELAALLPKECKIVFTTAYAEYAINSYDYCTIDYLVKPIMLPRFLAAVEKIETRLRSAPIHEKEDIFFVKSGSSLNNIKVDDILYFEAQKEYVRLVTARNPLLVYRRLKDIEAQLKLPFVRVHHSFIVNIRKIEKIKDNQIFIGNISIPITDKYRQGLMETINKQFL